MSRGNKPLPLYEGVEIIDIGAEGKAIARVDGVVVFTTGVIPGDIVDLQVTKKREKYQEARVVRIQTDSPDRIPAFCEHFDICGGCKWQYLQYDKQLYYKQKQVYDQLKRIGKVAEPVVMPIKGSADSTFYRNKLEFTFSNRRWLTNDEVRSGDEFGDMDVLGFHVQGMFDKVLNVNKCWLQPDPSNEIRNAVKDYATKNKLAFYDLRNKEGFLRNLIIRTTTIGELMVIVNFFSEDIEKREDLLNFLYTKFPQITSLLYVINQKGNDTITDQEVIIFKGRDYIIEEMEGLRFIIGPKSFYQTNSLQAYELYKVARDFAELTGKEIVYDLYTGTGTIACFIASKAAKVIGIEYVPEAIADAKVNARNNQIANTSFFAGDMKDILTKEFIEVQGHPDVIITDPPRAGMHEEVIAVLLFAAPERIVYVSCNPATQARDIALLSGSYQVTKVQPVDMFPHTHHVENVVLLEKLPKKH
ncbi:MAG: 23S rRNA (uracil(1939)-C(5))-methyltransferase RlmD [Mariniphaga sp.]